MQVEARASELETPNPMLGILDRTLLFLHCDRATQTLRSSKATFVTALEEKLCKAASLIVRVTNLTNI